MAVQKKNGGVGKQVRASGFSGKLGLLKLARLPDPRSESKPASGGNLLKWWVKPQQLPWGFPTKK